MSASTEKPMGESNRPPKLDPLFLSIGQAYRLPKEPIEWCVNPLCRVGGNNMLYGFPGHGKSALMRRLAVSVLKGEPFLGYPVQKRGAVFYLCAEDMIED